MHHHITKNEVKPYIPGIATALERRIHSFLNSREVFLVDIKGFIEDQSSSKLRSSNNSLILRVPITT